jgi:hypothetical protein
MCWPLETGVAEIVAGALPEEKLTRIRVLVRDSLVTSGWVVMSHPASRFS